MREINIASDNPITRVVWPACAPFSPAILRAVRASPWSPEFMASVAVDRSLSRRMNGTPAMERARVKTGTLRDASAVAGYVTSVAGEEYVVAAMINDPRASGSVARPVLDALLEWIARGRARTPP